MADLHPVLSREQAMEVLLESLFLPLPVYPTTPSGAAAASNLDLIPGILTHPCGGSDPTLEPPDTDSLAHLQLLEAARGESSPAHGRVAALPSQNCTPKLGRKTEA